jgi:hypothetical protein
MGGNGERVEVVIATVERSTEGEEEAEKVGEGRKEEAQARRGGVVVASG